MSKPNVLWITTDQHTFGALSCMGHPVVKTPNIDRLAEEGVVFERAYSPSPVCGPARASLFTGLYPRNHGVTGNNSRFEGGVRVLPELLRENGYDTALVGKLHYLPKTAPHGFEYRKLHDAMYDVYNPEEPWTSEYVHWLAEHRFDGDVQAVIDIANEDETALRRNDMRRFLLGSNWRTEEEHSNTWVTRETVDYLRRRRNEPFFLFASYFGPHQPMLAPGRWSERLDPDDVPLPDEFYVDFKDKPIARAQRDHGHVLGHFNRYGWTEDQYREVLAAYYSQIEMIDAGVGTILDTLDSVGLAETTIVVLTSDHGDHAGQFGWFFKGTMYERSVHVPLLVRDPVVSRTNGARSQHVVNGLDLFETVADWSGLDHAEETSSRSLTPLLDDPERDDWDDVTYSELGDTQMLVTDGYKLIRGTDADSNVAHELYDMRTRPFDSENLWGQSKYRTQQNSLVTALQAREETIARVHSSEL